jgi:gliding motility-associated-like protein
VISVLEDPSGLPAGTYQVTAVDNNGCIVDTSIVLTDPEPLSGPAIVTTDYNGSDISCYQLSDGGVTVNVQGGTPGYTYSWSNGTVNNLGSSSSLSGIPEGTYTVTVTDINGCTYATSVLLNQPTQVLASSSVLSFYFGQGVSCEGASDGIINASGSGGTPGYSYSWNTNPAQNNATIGGLPTGTYTVTLTDLNGCTATSSVTLTANPIPQAVLPPPINGCIGGGVLINANAEAGQNCTWTFSDGQVFNQCGPFVANFDAVDCYGVQLTVISAEGCVSTASSSNFVCIQPNPVASFYADTYQIDNIQTNANFWNESIGADSYFWYYGDGSNYDTTFNAHHEFLNGSDFDVTNYQVTLYAVSQYGCIDSTSRYIQMIPEVILYVPNAFTPDGDSYNNTFYPVLTAGYSKDDYEFLIFNRWGELIFESNTVGEGWDGTYRDHKCQVGVYTWKLVLRRSFNDDKLDYVGHVTLLRGGGM